MTVRIAWIVYGSLEQVSGGYIYDRLVVEQLRALGDSVTVVSLTPGQTELPDLRAGFDVLVGDELCFRELVPLSRVDFSTATGDRTFDAPGEVTKTLIAAYRALVGSSRGGAPRT